MTSDVKGLVEELSSAFRGPGLLDHSWRQRVDQADSQLASLAGVNDLDSDPVATKKLREWVRYTVSDYPDEVQTVLCVAAGLHPTIRHNTLGAREDCLAGRLEISKRTVQRRVEEALEQLGRDGIANHGRMAAADHRGYVVARQNVFLDMRLDPPEVTEVVVLEVTAGRLDSIVRPVSVPHDAYVAGGFGCMVLAGGEPRKTERRPGELDLLSLHIDPGRVLERGDKHRVKIRYTVRPEPFLVVIPQTPYDLVSLKVRFDPDRQPSHVWRLDRAAQWENGELLPPDPSGRYESVAFGLRPGFRYGLRWEWDGPATD
jgi:hypothetical protein